MRSKSEAGDPIRRPNHHYSSGSGSDDHQSPAASVAIHVSVDSATDASIELDRLPHLPPPPRSIGGQRRRIRVISSSSSATSLKQRKALLSLAFACLWPVLLLILLSRHDDNRIKISKDSNIDDSYGGDFDSMLMSYDGLPQSVNQSRVAVVIVVPSSPPPPPPFSVTLSEDDRIIQQKQRRAILDYSALQAVESIFRTTHRHRIFVVVVVFDGGFSGEVGVGTEEKKLINARLHEIDNAGRTSSPQQQQQLRRQKYQDENTDKQEDKGNEENYHPEKIYTIYNTQSLGVSASRRKAAKFVNLLVRKHEESGSKSKEEELILLFLRCDAQIRELYDENNAGGGDGADGSRIWLDDVSDALLLTSSVEKDGNSHARISTPANAISLVIDYSSISNDKNNAIQPSKVGTTYSFDKTFHPIHSIASSQDMALANGMSFPTPLTGGAATALRLYTYNSLPSNDDGVVTNHYAADLELSFNLWMCADGIDILDDGGGGGKSSRLLARVVVNPMVLSSHDVVELSGPMAARIVSAWMSGHDDEVYYSGILKEFAEHSASVWWHSKFVGLGVGGGRGLGEERILLDKVKEIEQTLVRIASEVRQSPTFPSGLEKKCRPFSWFAQHVHTRLDFIEGGNNDRIVENVNADKPHLDSLHQRIIANNTGKEVILPSLPLDSGRMAIISKASPVKLAYVDASGGHVAHPHMGATDENGVYGYVHDETALHNNPPQFIIKGEDERSRLCRNGDPNYEMLTKKVYVDLPSHEAAEKRVEHGLGQKKRVKIFCFVYTTEQNHDRIPAIHETWG